MLEFLPRIAPWFLKTLMYLKRWSRFKILNALRHQQQELLDLGIGRVPQIAGRAAEFSSSTSCAPTECMRS